DPEDPDPAAVPVLVELLRDDHWEVRSSAAMVLARLGPASKPAIPLLIEIVQTESGTGWKRAAKADAVEALGAIGPEAREAAPALAPLLHQPDQVLRLKAAEALRRVDPEAAAREGIR